MQSAPHFVDQYLLLDCSVWLNLRCISPTGTYHSGVRRPSLYVFIDGRKGGDKTLLNAIALVNHIAEIFTETETDIEMKKHKSTFMSAIIVCL